MTITFFAVLATIAIVGATITGTSLGSASSLGTLTFAANNSLMVQKPSGTVTPVAQVRDQFTNPGTGTINNRTATFNNGSGTFTTPAPNWTTYSNGTADASSWFGSGNATDGAIRTGGTNYATALVPWLTRKSTASMNLPLVDLSGTDRTNAGIILNSNATGTSGIAAVVDCNTTCTARLLNITGAASSTACGTAVALNTGGTVTAAAISAFTNTPGAGGSDVTATFSRTGGTGGTSPTTITCEPSSAPVTGGYSGMIALTVTSATTRFDTPLFSYS